MTRSQAHESSAPPLPSTPLRFDYAPASDSDPATASASDTSLTNFFAFMLGSITAIPAVEYFCLYAGISILFDFFLQVCELSRAILYKDGPACAPSYSPKAVEHGRLM